MRRPHNRYNRPYISDLRCPVCGATMPVLRPSGTRRPEGHIKTMYCPGCKEERDLEEAGFYGKHEEATI